MDKKVIRGIVMTKEQFITLFNESKTVDDVKRLFQTYDLEPSVKDELIQSFYSEKGWIFLDDRSACMLAGLCFDAGKINIERFTRVIQYPLKIAEFYDYLFDFASDAEKENICKFITSINENFFYDEEKEILLNRGNRDIVRWVKTVNDPIPLVRALLRYPELIEERDSIQYKCELFDETNFSQLFSEKYDDIERRLAQVFKIMDKILLMSITDYMCRHFPDMINRLRPLIWEHVKQFPLDEVILFVYAQSVEEEDVKRFINIMSSYLPAHIIRCLPEELVLKALSMSDRQADICSLISSPVSIRFSEKYLELLKECLSNHLLAFRVVVDERAPYVIENLSNDEICVLVSTYTYETKKENNFIEVKLHPDDIKKLLKRLAILSLFEPRLTRAFNYIKTILNNMETVP